MSSAAERREVIVIARESDEGLAAWIDANDQRVAQALARVGAVLFRGFHVTSVTAFEQVARRVCGEIVTENAEHTPVSRDGAVQTPVPYSAERLLLWHNENSFNDEWPLRILFCCVRPADTGGETPIVDSGLVYREIDPAIRRRFEEKGVAYVRNFGSGVGLDWRTVFRTEDRAEVERHCREHHIVAQWQRDGRLRTIATRPAIVAHPVSGEPSWFNQAQHWHPSCLDPDVRQALEHSLGPDDLPRDCTFGDGSRIDDEDMRQVLSVYRRCETVFPWQAGDVLLLDNVMWAHGRNPYTGRRTMLVAMGSLHRHVGVGVS